MKLMNLYVLYQKLTEFKFMPQDFYQPSIEVTYDSNVYVLG